MTMWLRAIAFIGMVVFLKMVKQEVVPAIFVIKMFFAFFVPSFVLAKLMKKQHFIKVALGLSVILPLLFWHINAVMVAKYEIPFLDVLNADKINVFYSNLLSCGLLVFVLAYFSFFKKRFFNTFFVEKHNLRRGIGLLALLSLFASPFLFRYKNVVVLKKDSKETILTLKEMNKSKKSSDIAFPIDCYNYEKAYNGIVNLASFKDVWVKEVALKAFKDIDMASFDKLKMGAADTKLFEKGILDFGDKDYEALDKRLSVCLNDKAVQKRYIANMKKVASVIKGELARVLKMAEENQAYYEDNADIENDIEDKKKINYDYQKFTKLFPKWASSQFYGEKSCNISDIVTYYSRKCADIKYIETNGVLTLKIKEKGGQKSSFIFKKNEGGQIFSSKIMPSDNMRVRNPSEYIENIVKAKYPNISFDDLIFTNRAKDFCQLLRFDYAKNPLPRNCKTK